MSHQLAVQIGGKYVPLAECDWVLWGSCGCPFGVTVGRSAPTPGDAWKALFGRKREIARAQRQGQHLELMTHRRWCDEVAGRMKDRCPHAANGRRSR